MPAGNGSGGWAETSSRPEILSVHPRPIDLVYALRRRWGWALGLGLLCTSVAVAIAWWWIPVNYTATAWLRIAQRRPQILFATGREDQFLNHRRAQATLITSNIVLNPALRQPGVAQLPYLRDERDPVTWMKNNVSVTFPGNSEIMQIGMTGDDPVQLRDLVKAVRTAYMDEIVAQDRNDHLRRKSVLKKSYDRNMLQIKRKSVAFQQLAEQLGTSDSEAARAKQISTVDSLADLRSKVNTLRRQISGLDRKILILKARLGQNEDGEESEQDDEESLIERLVEMAVAQDPWIARSRSQVMGLETAKFEESLRAREGAGSPGVSRLQERIDYLLEGIAKRREVMLPQVRKYVEEQVAQGVALAPPTQKDQIRQLIKDTELDKGVMESELEVATADFEEEAKAAVKLGAYSGELEEQKIELERLKKITEKMGNELEQWEVELAAAPRVTLLQAETVPRTNDLKSKLRKVSIVGLAAFGLAVLGVAAVDFLSRRVNSPAEVAYGLGVQVMGDLPMVSGRGWRNRRRVNGAAAGPLHGMLIESVDNIRTALLHRADSESLRAVLVTSALEKEGKTTLASQLAASLARSGRRTLLLDGDLRRPSQHRLFELPLHPGLSELLRGEADLEDVIRPTRVAGLWLAPAGACDLDAVQALAKGGFSDTFARLRGEFDFIVIDSGPVLTHADALLFGQYADAVILSVLRDISRVRRVFEACERIRAVDLRLLGAVVNGTSTSTYRSYYHYRPYAIEVESSPV